MTFFVYLFALIGFGLTGIAGFLILHDLWEEYRVNRPYRVTHFDTFNSILEAPLDTVLRRYQADLETLLGGPVSWSRTGSSTDYSFLLRKAGDEWVSTFRLVQLPGCCGVCVSTGSEVSPAFRRKGLGTLLNSLRSDLATSLGYGLLICTDVAGNKPQRRILAKNGWSDLTEFRNPRTGNQVFVSARHLRKDT